VAIVPRMMATVSTLMGNRRFIHAASQEESLRRRLRYSRPSWPIYPFAQVWAREAIQ
jgi:hypothetical protein